MPLARHAHTDRVFRFHKAVRLYGFLITGIVKYLKVKPYGILLLVGPESLAARRGELLCQQCFPFPGIGPEAESSHVTLRIKYGIYPGISGICPNPAAESNLG